MTDAVVITSALVAARLFSGNFATARAFLESQNLFGGLLKTACIQQNSAGQRLVNETNPFTRPTQSDDLSVSL